MFEVLVPACFACATQKGVAGEALAQHLLPSLAGHGAEQHHCSQGREGTEGFGSAVPREQQKSFWMPYLNLSRAYAHLS